LPSFGLFSYLVGFTSILNTGHLIGRGKNKKLCGNFQVYYAEKYVDYAENTLDYAEI